MSEIHPQARTTPRTRAEINASSASLTELAERYNVSVATVRKWKRRETPEDLSHRPHTLSTTLTAAQEAIVVDLRPLVLLPLDDLLVISCDFINPHVYRFRSKSPSHRRIRAFLDCRSQLTTTALNSGLLIVSHPFRDAQALAYTAS